MAMHALLNTASAGYVFRQVPPEELTRFWTVYGGVWLALGLAAVTITRGRLAREPIAP